MPQTQEDRDVQEVVRAHAGWVFACAKRRVRDDALAEDVAQAVFILFWQKGKAWGAACGDVGLGGAVQDSRQQLVASTVAGA